MTLFFVRVPFFFNFVITGIQFCHHRNPKTGKALGYWDDSLKFMGGTIMMTTTMMMMMMTMMMIIMISTHQGQGSQKKRSLAIIFTWQ